MTSLYAAELARESPTGKDVKVSAWPIAKMAALIRVDARQMKGGMSRMTVIGARSIRPNFTLTEGFLPCVTSSPRPATGRRVLP